MSDQTDIGMADPQATVQEAEGEDIQPFRPDDTEAQNLRVLEALLFASREPLGVHDVRMFISDGFDIDQLFVELSEKYVGRGVNLVRRGNKWAFRTAEDLGFLLRREDVQTRPLTRVALETLAIIAFHQTVTRAEIEEIRGVATGRGTLDILMEAGWVKMRGRRRTPGRPVTYGTTQAFLDHFSLASLSDLPGLEELKGAGLLSNRLPTDMQIPLPFDGKLRDDEDALTAEDREELGISSSNETDDIE